MLRNYGIQGVFDKISALIFAIPYRYTANETVRLHQEIVKVVSIEFGRPELPIVADMDFGHTSPQFIMPNGCLIEIDCDSGRVALIESSVS